MTEAEWLKSFQPSWAMLHYLKPHATPRKLRLFACGFPRLHFHLFQDERSRTAVTVAEDFAGAKATSEQLAAANAVSESLVDWDTCLPDWEGQWAVHPLAKMAALTSRANAFQVAQLVPQMISDICYYGPVDPDFPESKLMAAVKDLGRFASLLRCVFGNPFRPVAFDAAWLTPGVVELARIIYENRAFGYLPILADALNEAGCDNADILAHCRQPGEHVRGCWVLDLLLGRE